MKADPFKVMVLLAMPVVCQKTSPFPSGLAIWPQLRFIRTSTLLQAPMILFNTSPFGCESACPRPPTLLQNP